MMHVQYRYNRGRGGPILLTERLSHGTIIKIWDVRYTVIEVESNPVGEFITFLDRPLETCIHPGDELAVIGHINDRQYGFTECAFTEPVTVSNGEVINVRYQFTYDPTIGEAHDEN